MIKPNMLRISSMRHSVHMMHFIIHESHTPLTSSRQNIWSKSFYLIESNRTTHSTTFNSHLPCGCCSSPPRGEKTFLRKIRCVYFPHRVSSLLPPNRNLKEKAVFATQVTSFLLTSKYVNDFCPLFYRRRKRRKKKSLRKRRRGKKTSKLMKRRTQGTPYSRG